MCLQAPQVTPPTLGGGLSIDPPNLGTFSGDLALCCKVLPFSVPLPPVPLPPLVVNGSVTALIATAFATIQTYLDALSVDCSLE
jgi:hypothetical protein